MSRTGNGEYVAPNSSWKPAIGGVLATAGDWNALLADLSAALTQSVSRDGQSPMLGNLPMGNNKITGLAPGAGTGEALAFQQLFSQGTMADIASAATTDIGQQNTSFLRVTGTTTITSFGTNYRGPRFLTFADAVTLTNSSTLVLPGGADITTAAGDSLIVIPGATLGTADKWIVVAYQAATGYLKANNPSYTGTLTGGTINSAANPLILQTGGAERMRIDSSGNLLVGTTSVQSSAKVSILGNESSSADAAFITLKGGGENIGWINYDNAFGTMVRLTGTKQGGSSLSDEGYFSVRTARDMVLTGGVFIQDGGTSWSAISDERQKTDLKPIENAANKVATLRAVTGRYLTDDATMSRAFLIAQDVQKVLPEAVVETEQDGVSALGLSYTEVIPLLVAAIQEQQAIIEQLKARLDAANL